jgi:hypothetical protein
MTVFSSSSSPLSGLIAKICCKAYSKGNISGTVIITLQRAAAALSLAAISTELSYKPFNIEQI